MVSCFSTHHSAATGIHQVSTSTSFGLLTITRVPTWWTISHSWEPTSRTPSPRTTRHRHNTSRRHSTPILLHQTTWRQNQRAPQSVVTLQSEPLIPLSSVPPTMIPQRRWCTHTVLTWPMLKTFKMLFLSPMLPRNSPFPHTVVLDSSQLLVSWRLPHFKTVPASRILWICPVRDSYRVVHFKSFTSPNL